MDKGRFWDFLIYICIPSAIINFILLIFYFIRRSGSGYVFVLFFLVFLAGIVLSGLFGPFRLYRDAMESYESKQYSISISNFETILKQYPGSKYAEDSKKRISYAYFLNGDYASAIKYFKEAIDNGIINGQELEIKKIFAESHSRIGEDYYSEKDYAGAADNYLDAVQYYSDIEKKFPDTNEAFIAKYKIPEFLFKASESFNRMDMWDMAAENLSVIISSYPESEYYKKANDLLFNIYISRSEALKENGQYRESILEFLKIFSFPEEILKEKKYRAEYLKASVLRNIPVYNLTRTADEVYRQAMYADALLLYEYIALNFPDSLQEIVNNFTDCKIRIISVTVYNTLPEIKTAGNFAKEGLARITMENKTEHVITLYISGPQDSIFTLEKETKLDIEIPSGSYAVAAELINTDTGPFYGEITLEEGVRYRQIFDLAKQEP
ncbi:MAG: outer membrane protein assembly factor BamD [Actinobacteria bacterium]|nr:outer membrane protein assembly factor BamD [Actinomycetota bacterium]